jgi:hypothetical protein
MEISVVNCPADATNQELSTDILDAVENSFNFPCW